MEAFFPLRATTTAADSKRDARAPRIKRARASGIARRRTEEERVEAFFPLRATTTASDSKRDARALRIKGAACGTVVAARAEGPTSPRAAVPVPKSARAWT